MIDDRELLERELERFAPEPGILERVTRRRERKQRRQRLAAGALGLAVAVVVIAAAAALRLSRSVPGDDTTPPPPTISASPAPLVELGPGYHVVNIFTGEATRLPTSITAVEGASNFEVSPDGSMLLFDNSGFEPASLEPGLHQVFVANVDGSGARAVTQDAVGASSGSWSPDGSAIVYVGGRATPRGSDMDLSVVDVGTGAVSVVLDHAGAGPHFENPWRSFEEPRFSSDGRSIVFTRWDQAHDHIGARLQPDLWIVPLEGGKPTVALRDRGFARASPSMTRILFQRLVDWFEGNASGRTLEVWISDADGRHPHVLVPLSDGSYGANIGGGWSPDGDRIAYDQYGEPRRRDNPETTTGVFVLNMKTGNKSLVAYGRSVAWLDDGHLIIKGPRSG